jgi:hypothetical protein
LLHISKVLKPGFPKDAAVCIENIRAEGGISEDVINCVSINPPSEAALLQLTMAGTDVKLERFVFLNLDSTNFATFCSTE